jgi:hypothetical protein
MAEAPAPDELASVLRITQRVQSVGILTVVVGHKFLVSPEQSSRKRSCRERIVNHCQRQRTSGHLSSISPDNCTHIGIQWIEKAVGWDVGAACLANAKSRYIRRVTRETTIWCDRNRQGTDREHGFHREGKLADPVIVTGKI